MLEENKAMVRRLMEGINAGDLPQQRNNKNDGGGTVCISKEMRPATYH